MRRLFGIVVRIFKWLVIVVISVEIVAFVGTVVINYLLDGRATAGWKTRYDPYTIYGSLHGERLTAYNSGGPDQTKNRTIWLFGGSTLNSGDLPEEKTIPSILAKVLNSNQHGFHFTLRNFAVEGYNSLSETKQLQKMLIESPSAPDLVIFYDGVNDACSWNLYRTSEAHNGYDLVKGLIEAPHRSRLAFMRPLTAALYLSYTREIYKRIMCVAAPTATDSLEFKKTVQMAGRRYDHIYKMLKGYGTAFLVVWQPWKWVEECGVHDSREEKDEDPTFVGSYLSLQQNYRRLYYALLKKLKDKPYFVSIPNVLCGQSVYLPDGVHLTAAGNELVAHQLNRILIGRSRDLFNLEWVSSVPEVQESATGEAVEFIRNGGFRNGMDQWACSAEHYFVNRVGSDKAVFWAHHGDGSHQATPVLYQDVWGVPGGTTVKLSVLIRNSKTTNRTAIIHIWEGQDQQSLGGKSTARRLSTDWQQYEIKYKKKKHDSKLRVEIFWRDRNAVSVQIDKVSLRSSSPLVRTTTKRNSGI